jgi:hypothetical protein
MKRCPVCQTLVDDSYTSLCSNADCVWEFELYTGDTSPEIEMYTKIKLQEAKSKYSIRKAIKNEHSSPHYSFNDVHFFTEGMAGVRIKDKWGFIDKNCTLVIPCIYDKVCPFSENLAVVKVNDKYGYINKKGELVIPCTFDDASNFKNGIAKVHAKGKWEQINLSGKFNGNKNS